MRLIFGNLWSIVGILLCGALQCESAEVKGLEGIIEFVKAGAREKVSITGGPKVFGYVLDEIEFKDGAVISQKLVNGDPGIAFRVLPVAPKLSAIEEAKTVSEMMTALLGREAGRADLEFLSPNTMFEDGPIYSRGAVKFWSVAWVSNGRLTFLRVIAFVRDSDNLPHEALKLGEVNYQMISATSVWNSLEVTARNPRPRE